MPDEFLEERDYLLALRQFIEAMYDSQAEFCRRYNIPKSSLNTFLSGKKRMSKLEARLLNVLGLRRMDVIVLDDSELKSVD